jgi:hypothetical protein
MKILWGHQKFCVECRRMVTIHDGKYSKHGPGKTGFFCSNSGARADEPKNDSFCPNCAGSGQYKADGKLKPCPVCLETGIKEI